MSSTPLTPITSANDESRTYRFPTGDVVRALITNQDTGGKFAFVQGEFAPGSGATLHVHSREDEMIYVIDGLFEIRVGENVFNAPSGAAIFLPRDIPHSFKNISDTAAQACAFSVPGGFVDYFAEVFALFSQPEPDMAALMVLSEKYGITELEG